jgi:hypothetical protein
MEKIYKMQHLEGSGTPVLYIGRMFLKGSFITRQVIWRYNLMAKLLTRYFTFASFFPGLNSLLILTHGVPEE